MNHPAVVKAAQEVYRLAESFFDYDDIKAFGANEIAALIERETKYSRLVEAATKVAYHERGFAELRALLAEIQKG